MIPPVERNFVKGAKRISILVVSFITNTYFIIALFTIAFFEKKIKMSFLQISNVICKELKTYATLRNIL